MNARRIFFVIWMVSRLLASDPFLSQSVILIEQGKVKIAASNAAGSQTLGVWVRESLNTLESLWGIEVPFQSDVPLELVILEDLEKVELWERWQGGVLRQRIGIPQDPQKQDPLVLADALTRALSHRGLLAATSGKWVNAPDWWVRGHSLHLLTGGATAALQEWSASSQWHWPETLAGRTPAEPISLQTRAEELLLCRWIREQAPAKSVWTWLATWNSTEAAERLETLSGSRDLRELHIQWTLWTEADRNALLSEYRLHQAALKELESRVRFHPALLGVSGLPERYRSLDLEEVSSWAHTEGMKDMMIRWSFRLQPLAFRQSQDVNQVVKGYLDAGRALGSALESKGRKRQQALTRFQEAFVHARTEHHQLLLGMGSE